MAGEFDNGIFFRFLAIVMLVILSIVGYCGYRVHQRNQALDSFCKTNYGSSFVVDTWSHGNQRNTYQIACKMSTNSVLARLDY